MMRVAIHPPLSRRRGLHGSRRALVGLVLAGTTTLCAQAIPGLGAYTQRFHPPEVKLQPIAGVRERIQGGKLYLRLNSFLKLALANNTDVNIARLDVDSAGNAVLAAKAPFDPTLGLNYGSTRYFQPQTSQLGGANTLASLNSTSQVSFTQSLASGQNVSIGFNGSRNTSNSRFSVFNPSIQTGLSFAVSQPLLRNRGNLANRANLLIARAVVQSTVEQTEAHIGDLITAAAGQYWDAVQARDTIQVEQESLDLAEKSYAHDKQALDLGALPKGDIYQSQAQVASRKLALLQAQYAYRERLDGIRRLIGADLLPATRDIPIVLEDDPASLATFTPPTTEQAIADALRTRPELKSIQRRFTVNALNARVARSSLLPQLDLGGQYGSNGVGGNLLPSASTSFVPGGLGDALHHLFGFGSPFYGFTLQLSIPVRSSAAEARLSDALLSQTRDHYSERQEQQQIIQDVKLASNQLDLAQAQIETARISVELTQKNVDAEQQKYLLGATTSFELLQVQQQLTQAKSALLNANVEYQKAVMAEKRATWTLLDGLGIVVAPPLVR